MIKLDRKFFENSTLKVAQNLIGKSIVHGDKEGVIIETEAYFGSDPASHGASGLTKRNFPMFGPAGFSYVYFIYGMYHCFNITTEKENSPAAVLIRGVKTSDNQIIDGPGKLCKYFGITREHNNIDLCDNKEFFIKENKEKLKFISKPRVGIKKNIEKLWRFVAV